MTEYIFPESMAACADLLYVRREQRLAADKVADELKKEEVSLENWIIDHLPKSDATGVAGHIARVQVLNKTVPRVVDWPALYKYISKNKAWELLQRRVGEGAVKERWEAGKEVPGVEHYSFPKVSIHKVEA